MYMYKLLPLTLYSTLFFIILGVHVDDMNDFYTEEVLEEDGEVVEYFGYDQPAV